MDQIMNLFFGKNVIKLQLTAPSSNSPIEVFQTGGSPARFISPQIFGSPVANATQSSNERGMSIGAISQACCRFPF
jgi:hypothetical protein